MNGRAPDALRKAIATNHKFWPPNNVVYPWILDKFPDGYQGHCVDVGASDGVSINSTYLLEANSRWTVLSIEANPFFRAMLNKYRALVECCAVGSESKDEADFHINLGNLEAYSSLKPSPPKGRAEEASGDWTKTKVPVRTLNELLEKYEFPKLDVLCADTEGTERDVLAGLDLEKWRPRVILVECWEEGSLDDVLVPAGYERVWRCVDNDGYVRRNDEPVQ